MFFISVVKQYERAVIFRLGRYTGTRGPGLVILIPFVDRGVKVDMRELVLDEPAQSSITKDNALVDIDFVVYMRVVDAEAAVINIQNYIRAVRNLATTTLRAVIGDITVEEVGSVRSQGASTLRRHKATSLVVYAAASSLISECQRVRKSRRCSVNATWAPPRRRTRKYCRSSSNALQKRDADSKLPKPCIG